jgi:hypothetical protein
MNAADRSLLLDLINHQLAARGITFFGHFVKGHNDGLAPRASFFNDGTVIRLASLRFCSAVRPSSIVI